MSSAASCDWWGKGPHGPYLIRAYRMSGFEGMPSEWEALTLTQARRTAWREFWTYCHRVVVYRVRGGEVVEVFAMVKPIGKSKRQPVSREGMR